MSDGRSSRASAITVPGMVLSQPDSATTASNRCPRVTSSMESAMTSRLTSEAFIPSVPMEMPSETATVLNSMGVPPAARTPSLTLAESRRRWKLHGITSIQVLAMPTSGRSRSSSVNPTALNMARDGARSGPWVMVRLCRFSGSAISVYSFPARQPFVLSVAKRSRRTPLQLLGSSLSRPAT